MKAIIIKIEDRAINNYGFEDKRTIAIFKLTQTARKMFKVID